jgi:PhnB protein
MSHTQPSPDVMRGVIPYLAFAGRAGEAADFYARAFAALDIGRMPVPDRDDRYMHIQIVINDGAFMMTDHVMEGAPTPTSIFSGHLQLVVGDGRAWWERAIAAGCREVRPFEKQFWGDEWGLLLDPYGIHWAILQPGAPTTP